jgi:uncharacterized membrane protein (DUF373 family)
MKFLLTYTLLWVIPFIAWAQTTAPAPVKGIKKIFVKILTIINQITSVLFALAIMFFIWNLVVYLFSSTQSEKRSEAAKYMLWGIISIFVMVGLYGFINILLETTGFRAGFFLPKFKY